MPRTGFESAIPAKQATADLRLSGHCDRQFNYFSAVILRNTGQRTGSSAAEKFKSANPFQMEKEDVLNATDCTVRFAAG
jgi:hypothetical protein